MGQGHRASPPHRLASLGFIAALAGCAPVSSQLLVPRPDPSAVRLEAAYQSANPAARDIPPEKANYEELRALDQRAADVGFRLAVSGAELCPKTAPLSGLTLHTLSQYGEETAPLVAAGIGRSGHPAVLTVAQGSPAALAGLRSDDVLLAIGGKPFPAGLLDPSGAYQDVLAAQAILAEGLAPNHPVILSIRRGGQDQALSLTPVLGCEYDIQIETGAQFGSAGADGRSVVLGDRSVAYTRDADELAVLIGHELAHNILGHARRVSGRAPLLRTNAEREADYLGLYLAARAGYDLGKAVPYWRRLAANFPQLPLDFLLHPLPLERVTTVSAIVEEIDEKRRTGAPLRPNIPNRF